MWCEFEKERLIGTELAVESSVHLAFSLMNRRLRDKRRIASQGRVSRWRALCALGERFDEQIHSSITCVRIVVLLCWVLGVILAMVIWGMGAAQAKMLWFCSVLVLVLTFCTIAGHREMKTRSAQWAARRREAGLCASCGYDLRHTTDRCPECGIEKGDIQERIRGSSQLPRNG